MEALQTWSQIVVVVGIVATALGGFGSYYFGKKVEEHRQAELQTSVEQLLNLESTFEPFIELARQARPDADQDAALAGLRDDIEELRQVASRHEFTPLAAELRTTLISSIRELAPDFENAELSIAITHETWTRSATRQYAAQLASLLRESGMQVQGPNQITYFLVTPSSPIEWGYNQADIELVGRLFTTLAPVMGPSANWTKAAHQKEGSVRIHFGGEVVFGANGVVEVQ